MVQRALLLGSSRGHLLKEDFFLSIPQLSKLPHKGSKTLEIQRALDAHEGNISKAARFLGLPRTTLRDKAKRLGLISY